MIFTCIQTINSNEKIEVHTTKNNAWTGSPIYAIIKCFHILLDDIFSVPLYKIRKTVNDTSYASTTKLIPNKYNNVANIVTKYGNMQCSWFTVFYSKLIQY
jgi:hypothetical protein